MSRKHPVIAVTGSSGSGSSAITTAFEHILARENASSVMIDGNGFHRYGRAEFKEVVERAAAKGERISHFSPDANLLDRLEQLLMEYSEHGTGLHRRYVHDEEEAARFGARPGTFTPWEPVPEGTDLLYYRGLHGCFVSESVDIARYMDRKIGAVPLVNLEWVQKIHRDTQQRGYTREAVTDTILRRMDDYVHYITPQFSETDINFQRVPTVDTSDPFAARDMPTLNESVVVIRFRAPAEMDVDFPFLLNRVHNSFMSRPNTIVVPGAETELAMELILEPMVHELLEERRRAQ